MNQDKTVFITGASGYIGGDLLSQLSQIYPNLNYRALVRGLEKGDQIKAAYPTVEIVYGGLDDETILETESANADIIIHTADAADNLKASQAIYSGILKGHSPDRPVYWLHTSGAGIFSYIDTDNETYGIRREKTFDDLEGIKEIITMPDHAFHRNVDKFVLEATAKHPETLKAAIISPNTVFGHGRGPCSRRSRQLYELSKWTILRKKAPVIGEGLSFGCTIHIADVTTLFLALFDAAFQGHDGFWGPEAYYLAESGEHIWGDVAKRVARIAFELGYIPAPETEPLDAKVAQEYAGYEAASWGLNVRCRALRARHLLGWKPAGPSLEEELPNIVREEWALLQAKY